MAVIATVTTRPLARRVATVLPAKSICDSSQPPKISPAGLASAGIAMARSAGSDCGGASVVSLALIAESSSSFLPEHGFVAHRFHDLQDRAALANGIGHRGFAPRQRFGLRDHVRLAGARDEHRAARIRDHQIARMHLHAPALDLL